ncbi:zinc metalloprotease [Hyalangium versicolor]|uniref:zinc metalloprotease n=1 Tax=Hyalangium versicolor TaxID=2861190 RepID=UPI001CCA5240|nr:zinc metalloprotease [Hyalangium versicolor]
MPKRREPNEGGQYRRTCATMDEHRRLARLSPEYRRRRREIELETRQFIARYADAGLRTGIVRIPVVVHVVWNTAAQNVSDAQIQSQINVLNADFRRMNADAASVPAVFAGVAADTRIEFALAVRDPACGSTNGITRTFTATTGFTMATRNNVKSAATGGADPWPSDRYLNMWVANFTDTLLGFATFPGGPADLDGFVVRTDAFGTIGTAAAPFNRGRTATHEIGHWLNLLDIWGDDESGAICSQSDECADTPNQGIMNFGTPAFPHVSCGNGPNGDMFMNYMDYVDDAAMFMFTQDQATRMNATLSVARASILSSDGLVPVSAGAVPDLWMQDNADDTGAEPDPSANPMWISDDIWVRNAPDGLTNQDHQNPRGEQLNHVYVRVRNRACSPVGSQSGTVKLYWAKASVALSWPAPWDGSVTVPALMGGLIGSQSVTVAGGDTEILSFDWTPPDPSDYAAFGADKAHFCLLARIETSPVAPFGMTTPETGNLYANVQNNNNIVWKNITVVDTDGDGGRFADVVLGNLGRERQETVLVFDTPRQRGGSLFDWGYLLVEFRGDALERWAKGDLRGDGFQRLEDGRLLITRPVKFLGPPLKPGEFGTLHVRFVPDGRRPTGAEVFELDVTAFDAQGQLVGGQRFLLRTADVRKRPCWDTQVGSFDGVDWIRAPQCGCGCGC